MGGIPYIGTDPNTINALGSLTKTIRNLAQPGFEEQRRFQEEALIHPEILQRLADMNYDNPGFARQFGNIIPPHIADVIGRMQPSSEAVMSRADRNLSPDLLRRGATRRVTGQTEEGNKIGAIQSAALDRVGGDIAGEATKDQVGSLVFPLDARLDAQRDNMLARFTNQTERAAAKERFDTWRAQFGAGEAMRRTAVMANAANGRQQLSRSDNDTRELQGYQRDLATAMRNYSTARNGTGRAAALAGVSGAIASINNVRSRYNMPRLDLNISETGRFGLIGNRLSITNSGLDDVEVDESDIGSLTATELPAVAPVNPVNDPNRTSFTAGSPEAGALAALSSAQNKTQAMALLRQQAPTIASRVIAEYRRLHPSR